MELCKICFVFYLNVRCLLPVDTVSLESGDTETCPLVERSPGHPGPPAHPAPKNTSCLLTFKLVYEPKTL